jgi:hypothetical protein
MNNHHLQDWEDKQIESDAISEARDMFKQYINSLNSNSRYVGMIIPKPKRFVINEYLGTKSKYTSDDYNDIRNKEFERLKIKYHDEQP